MGEFLNKRQFMAIALESTKGTAETLANGDAAIILQNVTAPHEIGQFEQDPHSADFSPFPNIPGRRIGAFTFSTIIRGSAAVDAVPVFGLLMQMAGFLETINASTSVVYTPVSSSLKTATVGLYTPQLDGSSGLRHQLYGCVCRSLRITFTNGEPPLLEGEIVGVFDGAGVTDQTPLTPTFDVITPQPFLGATFTIGGFQPKINTLTLDFGLTSVPRDDVSQASGVLYYLQGPRKPTLSFDMEQELVATEDPYGDILAANLAAVNLVHGSGDGKIFTFAMPKFQYIAAPTGERNGLATFNVEGKLARNTGNDEWVLTKT